MDGICSWPESSCGNKKKTKVENENKRKQNLKREWKNGEIILRSICFNFCREENWSIMNLIFENHVQIIIINPNVTYNIISIIY